MSFSIKIDGFQQVEKNLEGFGNASVETVQKIVNQTATVVMGSAKRYCPVDTGRLRGSIQVQSVVNTKTGAVAKVSPMTDYESYVEYGTSRMRAQPYMRPAALDGESFIERQGKIV